MANLSLKQEVRYVPNILGNRSLPEADQISFNITAGLTVLEVKALERQLEEIDTRHKLADDPSAEQILEFKTAQHQDLGKALESVAKVNPTSTTIDGKKIDSVAAYLEAVSLQVGVLLTKELVAEIMRVNSVGGQRALFSERSSGGTTSTG